MGNNYLQEKEKRKIGALAKEQGEALGREEDRRKYFSKEDAAQKDPSERIGDEHYRRTPIIIEDIKKPEKKKGREKETGRKAEKSEEEEETTASITPIQTESELEQIENIERKENNKSMIFLMPEGMIIMSVALSLDFIAPIITMIPYVGPILNVLFVISGISFFWLWGRFREKNIIEKRAAARRGIAKASKTARFAYNQGAKIAKIKKVKNIKWLRRIKVLKWFRPIVEFIPILNLFPLWSICSYLELKYS